MSNPVEIFVGEPRTLPNLNDINGPGAKFAFVQLILADRSRTSAVDLMEKLENEKKELAEAQEMLKVFQDKLAQAQAAPAGLIYMTAEEVQWCKDRGIDLPDLPDIYYGDKGYGPLNWERVCKSTQAYVDGLGDNSQSLMVLIQDALGQYNAYTQGASSNVSSANSIMQGLARW